MLLTTNASVVVKRIGSGAKRSYDTTVATLDVFIEPIQDELEPLYADQGGGQVYRMFADSLLIQIGDQIVEGAKKYKVEGVKAYHSFVEDHSQCIIRDVYD